MTTALELRPLRSTDGTDVSPDEFALAADSVDPVEGGSANDYDYANQDSCNNYDLDGRATRTDRIAAKLIRGYDKMCKPSAFRSAVNAASGLSLLGIGWTGGLAGAQRIFAGMGQGGAFAAARTFGLTTLGRLSWATLIGASLIHLTCFAYGYPATPPVPSPRGR